MYYMIDPMSKVMIDKSDELADLFKQLDIFTKRSRPIVITDETGEVRAGNTLGWPYVDQTVKPERYHFWESQRHAV